MSWAALLPESQVLRVVPDAAIAHSPLPLIWVDRGAHNATLARYIDGRRGDTNAEGRKGDTLTYAATAAAVGCIKTVVVVTTAVRATSGDEDDNAWCW